MFPAGQSGPEPGTGRRAHPSGPIPPPPPPLRPGRGRGLAPPEPCQDSQAGPGLVAPLQRLPVRAAWDPREPRALSVGPKLGSFCSPVPSPVPLPPTLSLGDRCPPRTQHAFQPPLCPCPSPAPLPGAYTALPWHCHRLPPLLQAFAQKPPPQSLPAPHRHPIPFLCFLVLLCCLSPPTFVTTVPPACRSAPGAQRPPYAAGGCTRQ